MLHSRLFFSILALSASVASQKPGLTGTKGVVVPVENTTQSGPVGMSIPIEFEDIKPVTNDDFIALEAKLKEFIAENPDRHIPLLVRNVFHDLFLQNQAGYHGCIMKPDFFNNLENAGLEDINESIKTLVARHFPETGFSMGDVIAFAGKVAVEAAYPCVNIDFKFNRSPCTQEDPIIANQAPSAFINSIRGLKGMLRYLGKSITAEDIAILFAGAHGIKGARAGPSGWFGVFATVTSGKDFIEKTFSSVWKGTSRGTLFQFFTGDTFDPQSSIIRLPSDMIFYPSKVPAGSMKDNSDEAKQIENKLKGFLIQDSSVFDEKFGQAITKLLAIGDGDQPFISNSISDRCPTKNNTSGSETSTVTETQAMSSTVSTSTQLGTKATTTVPATQVSSSTNAGESTTTTAIKEASSSIVQVSSPTTTDESTTEAMTTKKTTKEAMTTDVANSANPSATIQPQLSLTTTKVNTVADATSLAITEIATLTESSDPTTTAMAQCPEGYDDCVLSGSNMIFPYVEMIAALLLLA